MVKVIISVLLALLVVAYGAAFFAWNMTPQEVIGLQVMGQRYSQNLPIGSLVFVGLIIGAIIMGVAAVGTWSSQRARADKATAMVKKAKVKLQAQLDTINELRDEVDRLEAQIASLHAGNGTWGQPVYQEPSDEPEIMLSEPADTATAVPAQGEVDDDDII